MTAALRALIADDEQLARNELCYLLESFPQVEVVGQATNGLEAAALAKKLKPDLLFLDIQMPGLDGFQVVRKLMNHSEAAPRIIFVTAYDQYAIRAFEVNAIDYLLKPVERTRLGEAIARTHRQIADNRPLMSQIERILDALEHPLKRVAVKRGEHYMLVDSKDIVYATVEDGIVSIATDESTGTCNLRTLDELMASLDSVVFWRVHRSYIVNMQRIKEIIPWFNRTVQLKMSDHEETQIPVSRSHTRRLKEHLKL
jgi:two-component system LytT family response regulator/two-component system response regulator LytT